ncbi:septum formation inhibitor nucleotide-binding protein Maf [Komagataeibacter xylinus NBRC 15237]|nr:nucleoside triphosphate pyrophosphatase [Komagataeibacter xylinus]GBQ72739.1 septum formation inhibitor nucleotide-binding protein Maf [Komagataeibacter xylinus NBRC 15237]
MPDDSSLVLKAAPLQVESPPIVLASRSGARRALVESAGLSARFMAADVDEHAIRAAMLAAGHDASAAALELARAKARAVEVAPRTVVIGADQILSCGEEWFDKPADRNTARAQLRRLRGRAHVLHTAVCLLRDGHEVWHHVACPVLHMRAFSETFLEWYLAAEGEAILSCVGCYRLEGRGIQLFSRIEGEQSAIMGLPLLPLLAALRGQDIILP